LSETKRWVRNDDDMSKLKGKEWNKCGRREGDKNVREIIGSKKGVRNEISEDS
jgi:hypothetical protein